MTLSTHVLDLGAGRPAAGVAALLLGPDGESVGSGQTDGDGRLRFEGEFDPGDYTLRIQLEGLTQLYDSLSLQVRLREPRHYHLPVLVSPFGLTTYRGS
ncbi:MAG: hydroxyisourate hydrolase [Chloroflexi bacterium]|nr:MAG: hydroxyisourate hydrolase [Chloroflexota bacterium]